MKMLLLSIAILFLSTTASFGQKATGSQIVDKLEKITSVEEAKELINTDTTLVGQIISVNPERDSTAFDKRVIRMRTGEISELISDENLNSYIVKAIGWESVRRYRVSYIYLNGSNISKKEIDSLRELIMHRLETGEQFSDLASSYSMDGSASKGGDLGWFREGMMVKVFEDAVRSHSHNEVYFVDVPENNWFYVVKNTFDPVEDQVLKAIVVQVPE